MSISPRMISKWVTGWSRSTHGHQTELDSHHGVLCRHDTGNQVAGLGIITLARHVIMTWDLL